jgi:hypothetical protein
MPLDLTATCVCGARRRECNHWFLAREGKGSRRRPALTILAYTEAEARLGGEVLCGEACVGKWVGQRLGDLAGRTAGKKRVEEKVEKVGTMETREMEEKVQTGGVE